MSDMQKQFEEWAKENFFDTDKIISFTGASIDKGRYENRDTQTAWQAWQASRLAQVVTLPQVYDDNFGGHMSALSIEIALDDAGISYKKGGAK